MHRSIPPSEPRNRAVFAGICATVLGAVFIAAVIRACDGKDSWSEDREESSELPAKSPPSS